MFTPDQSKSGTPAPCAEYEQPILDLEHGQSTEPARRQVEAHLAGCPACRQFAEDLLSLDAALAAEFRSKELPVSFKAILLSRIDSEKEGATPELVARRKEAIESEFQQQSAGLFKRVVRERWGSFLDGLGLVTLALVAALILQRVLFQGFDFNALLSKALAGQAVTYVLWVTAAASVAGAVWIGSRGEVRRAVQWA